MVSTFRVESSRIIPNYLRTCRTWSLGLPTNCYACFAAPNERAGGTDKRKHSQHPCRLRLPLHRNRARMLIQTTLRTGLMSLMKLAKIIYCRRHAVNVPSRTVYAVAGANPVALQGTPSGCTRLNYGS